jgi:hypothetical protein
MADDWHARFLGPQLDLSAGKKGSFTSTQTGKTGSSMPNLFTVEAIDQADSNRVSNTNIKIPQDALLVPPRLNAGPPARSAAVSDCCGAVCASQVLHELYGQGLRVEDMLTSRKLVRFSLTRRQITRFCADPEQFSVEKVQLTRSAELGRTTDQRAVPCIGTDVFTSACPELLSSKNCRVFLSSSNRPVRRHRLILEAWRLKFDLCLVAAL